MEQEFQISHEMANVQMYNPYDEQQKDPGAMAVRHELLAGR